MKYPHFTQPSLLEKELSKQSSRFEKEDPFKQMKQAYRELDEELEATQFQIKLKGLKREMSPYVRLLEIMKNEVEHDIPYSTVTLRKLKNFLDNQSPYDRSILTKSNDIFLFRKEAYEFIDKVGYFKFNYNYSSDHNTIKCHDGDFDYDIHGNIISLLNDTFDNAALDFSDIECLGDL